MPDLKDGLSTLRDTSQGGPANRIEENEGETDEISEMDTTEKQT